MKDDLVDGTGGGRVRGEHSRWPIAALPAPLMSYLIFTEVACAVWAGLELVRMPADGHAWAVLVFLASLALAFEAGAARAARLRRRLSADLKHNMTSVWTVAGVVALPVAHAVLLAAAVFIFISLRQARRTGSAAYRVCFNGSTVVLACLISAAAMHAWSPTWSTLPWALSGSLSVLLVIAVQAGVNRGLVTIALLVTGVRGRVLVGTRDDNLTELATLCLGGLAALAALQEPWLCLLVIAPMIALQRGALVRELETAATTDAKTGLLNAVAWEHLAKREMARGLREEYAVGLLIIDVDRFKLVNDRFGHLAGDAVLRGVGKCLEASMREYDAVGRFGGEEFVAILPNAEEADAMVVAERTRSKINQLWVSDFVDGIPAESDLNLAVSIGVSCMPADGTEIAELLHAADGALYRAKAMGRNRVVLADRGAGDPFVRALLN